jgi:valyl-tRNA synthetase
MQGLHFTGKAPFAYVLLHGLVRDELGRKMSKSLDNGIDPLEVIARYGADALRYGLVTGLTPGNDTRYVEARVVEGRNLTNKIWNATRFVRRSLDAPLRRPPEEEEELLACAEAAARWIASRAARATQEVTSRLLAFDLGEALRAAQDFFWGELCDWYIEMSKLTPFAEATRSALLAGLRVGLRLLHPFLPFVTEAAWQQLPGSAAPLIAAPWPDAEGMDEAAEAPVELAVEVVRVIRSLRAEVGLPPGRKVPVVLRAGEAERAALAPLAPLIRHLGQVGTLDLRPEGADKPQHALSGRLPRLEVYLPLGEVVDLAQEGARLRKELGALEEELARVQARLASEAFRTRAPAEVVAREEERRRSLADRIQRARARIDELGV